MEHRTWTTVDKNAWGPGPWSSEPDKEQWTDAVTGYACLLTRGPLGALCGYVGVPDDHPWYDVDYDDIEPYPDVHGGLTYSSLGQGAICHVPEPGEPESLFWLGFDCAHAGDLTPAFRYYSFDEHTTYRTTGYVKAQCALLAGQAAAVSWNGYGYRLTLVPDDILRES